MNQEEMRLALHTALPILNAGQVLYPGDGGFAVAWLDIEERPDLRSIMQTGLGQVASTCTCFYAKTNQNDMQIGLRIVLTQPVSFNFSLVFLVRHYLIPLETLSKTGGLWLLPGPAPDNLSGPMTATHFTEQILPYCDGQGLFITLTEEEKMVLRGKLDEYCKSTRTGY